MNPDRKQFVKKYGLSFLGIALIISVVLNPTSGLKNGLVWAGLLYVVYDVIRSGRRLRAGGLGWPILIYCIVCFVSSWLSIDRDFSIRQWFKLVELIAGYLVVIHLLNTPRRAEQVVSWFASAMGVLAIWDAGRLMWELNVQHLVLDEGRWFDSLLGYPTIAAGMYGVALLVVVYKMILSRTLLSRMFGALSLFALIVLLYYLQTRSVIAGAVVGLFAFVFLAPIRKRLQIALIISAVCVLAVFVAIPGAFRDRLVSGSLSDRAMLWHDACEIISTGTRAEPWRAGTGFGYGHKIFEKLHESFPQEERYAARVYDHAHNLILELRIQTGFLGIAAFLAILAVGIARVYQAFPGREDRSRRLLSACLVGCVISLLVYGQFSMILAYLPALAVWTLLACLMAATYEQTRT